MSQRISDGGDFYCFTALAIPLSIISPLFISHPTHLPKWQLKCSFSAYLSMWHKKQSLWVASKHHCQAAEGFLWLGWGGLLILSFPCGVPHSAQSCPWSLHEHLVQHFRGYGERGCQVLFHKRNSAYSTLDLTLFFALQYPLNAMGLTTFVKVFI